MPDRWQEFQHTAVGFRHRDRRFRHRDRPFRAGRKIGHFPSEWPVTIRRNQRSRSLGMGGHDGSEYAPRLPIPTKVTARSGESDRWPSGSDAGGLVV